MYENRSNWAWSQVNLACMNDCSDPKTNDNFFDITKDFMSYFDQFYIWKRVLDKFEILLNVSY